MWNVTGGRKRKSADRGREEKRTGVNSTDRPHIVIDCDHKSDCHIHQQIVLSRISFQLSDRAIFTCSS